MGLIRKMLGGSLIGLGISSSIVLPACMAEGSMIYSEGKEEYSKSEEYTVIELNANQEIEYLKDKLIAAQGDFLNGRIDATDLATIKTKYEEALSKKETLLEDSYENTEVEYYKKKREKGENLSYALIGLAPAFIEIVAGVCLSLGERQWYQP